MNETMETILTRRSIRSYTDKEISAEDMNAILKAGMYAPTARDNQEWRFVVVKDPKNLKKIEKV